jgi:hypothetical protein
MFLATLREDRHHKLGEMLCKLSIVLGKQLKDGPVSQMTVADLGPKYSTMKPRKPLTTYPKICQGILTGEATRKIGKILNFTVHLTVPYAEFVYDGKTYAERLDSYSFIEVAALPLY